MADKPSYIVPYRSEPRFYLSLSGYLESIAHYSPPLKTTSLPAKAVKPAPAKKQEEKKKEKKEEVLALIAEDDFEDPWELELEEEEILDPPAWEPEREPELKSKLTVVEEVAPALTSSFQIVEDPAPALSSSLRVVKDATPSLSSNLKTEGPSVGLSSSLRVVDPAGRRS